MPGLEIRVSPPTMKITDVGGHLVFDAINHGPYYVTDTLSGSVTLGAYTTPPHNADVDYDLGGVTSGSTVVRGAVKITTGGGMQVAPAVNTWFTISGTFVHLADVQNFRSLAFLVNGSNRLILRDAVKIHGIVLSTGQSVGISSVSLSYYALVGRFAGV